MYSAAVKKIIHQSSLRGEASRSIRTCSPELKLATEECAACTTWDEPFDPVLLVFELLSDSSHTKIVPLSIPLADGWLHESC
ncbi:hypothetical protein SERLA73DRAFT_184628, partial [Serpula lacrymans var. lacrymans S7.3]